MGHESVADYAKYLAGIYQIFEEVPDTEQTHFGDNVSFIRASKSDMEAVLKKYASQSHVVFAAWVSIKAQRMNQLVALPPGVPI